MIIVSEVAHPGEVHLEVNSSILEIIGYINPDQQIVYRAETEQANAVKAYIKPAAKIKFIGYDKYYDPRSFAWSVRIFGEIKQIWKSLKEGKNLNADTFVWTCIFSTGHLFLSLCLLFFNNKNVKHLIVLHGELEFLKVKNKKKSEIFFGIVLKSAIKISRNNVRYIVLGDRIKDHLKAYFSDSVLKRVIPILHPYNYGNNNIRLNQFRNTAKPVAFASIGTQMLSKNSNYIFKLAQCLEEDVVSENIKFATIGKILPEIKPFTNRLVEQLYPYSFVPQSLFETEIKKMNFILFFYDNNSYQLCASGAIFEVIKLGLPIISIYNDYFDWLFQKYGQMGFLCNNLTEMKNIILQIMYGSMETEINAIFKIIEEFKLQNNLESIAADLSSKLS